MREMKYPSFINTQIQSKLARRAVIKIRKTKQNKKRANENCVHGFQFYCSNIFPGIKSELNNNFQEINGITILLCIILVFGTKKNCTYFLYSQRPEREPVGFKDW
jgi:hypothetical protein